MVGAGGIGSPEQLLDFDFTLAPLGHRSIVVQPEECKHTLKIAQHNIFNVGLGSQICDGFGIAFD